MDQRRFIVWITLSMAFLIGYQVFVLPILFPPAPQQRAENLDEDAAPADPDAPAVPEREDVDLAEADDPEPAEPEPVAEAGDEPAADEEPKVEGLPDNAEGVVKLGSMDPRSGFFMEVDLVTLGAAVELARLNDPRYTELLDRELPFSVVGGEFPTGVFVQRLRQRLRLDRPPRVRVLTAAPEEVHADTVVHELPLGRYLTVQFPQPLGKRDREEKAAVVADVVGSLPRTFDVRVAVIDEQLGELREGAALANVHWDLVALVGADGKPVDEAVLNEAKQDGRISQAELPEGPFVEAAFEVRAPDASLVVRKTYRLDRVEAENLEHSRDHLAEGYTLHMDLGFRNRGGEPVELVYELQGPVGVPLEDRDLARKFRDVKAAFLSEGGGVAYDQLTAGEVLDAERDKEIELWTSAVKYVGVDVQYFAALVMPGGNQLENPYLEHVEAELLAAAEKEEWSEISVRLTSRELTLAPDADAAITHEYDLFAGPKKHSVLAAIGAEQVVDYNWFPFGAGLTRLISTPLSAVLTFLHDALSFPYWLAIICLTVMVRGLMFPLSLKQNRNMQKMREIQPKLKELQTKYKDDKEKLSQAMMQLYRENDYNPMAGCLPLVFQLPIFIGLYQTFNSAVELRLAPFLWADNLAAPDQLFPLPFEMPFLGWDHFNLLPILTVGLMVVQQKLFMPPPADEQQAAQFKMMNYMMIFMGVIFYQVPAGLCLYFIASSLWGIAERKTLEIVNPKPKTEPAAESKPDRGDGKGRPRGGSGRPPKGGNGHGDGFFARLLAKADEAAKQHASAPAGDSGDGPRKGRPRSKGKRKKSRR